MLRTERPTPVGGSAEHVRPVINGDLPAKQYHLNEQTTWAVGYYTAYGESTSTIGALATWGLIAGLTE